MKSRGIQGKRRESDMEYVQELENLKKEINKSGRKIEDISDFMRNFSDINSLQEAIKTFREDNIFARIESKIDIIAQLDSSEYINLVISELNEDLREKHDALNSRIDSLEELNRQLIKLSSNKNENSSINSENLDDLNEIKEGIGLISSNYKNFLENLNNIQRLIIEFNENKDQTPDIEELISNVKNTLANVNKEEIAGIEEKFNNLINLFNAFQKGILNNFSDLDIKIININQKLASFDNFDGNFISVSEKLDTLKEALQNSDTKSMEEIAGNLNGLRENLSSLHEEIGKISLSVEQKSLDNELTEKISYLISAVFELKKETDSINAVLQSEKTDENHDQLIKSLQELPKVEFISENLANLTNLFAQIKARLDDEHFEEEIRQSFSRAENNFERLEEIIVNITAFDETREEIKQLNYGIEQIKAKINDNSDSTTILNNLSLMNSDIVKLQETLPEKIIYAEIKEGFIDLSAKVLEVYENLYPLQNLQTVNESFISAQDKLNIIIENLNANDIDHLEKRLDLNARLNEVQSNIDNNIANKINYAQEQLKELFKRTEELNNDVKSGNTLADSVKGDVKYLNLKADNLKELIDRFIKFNGNNNEKTESSFEEIKNALSFINQEIYSTRETTEKTLNTEKFKQTIDGLNDKLDFIREQVTDQTETDEIKHLLNCIKNISEEKLGAEQFKNDFDALNTRLHSIREQISDKSEINEVKHLLDSLKQASDEKLSGEELRTTLEALNTRIEGLKDKPDINELKELLNSVKEEIDSLKYTSDENLSAGEFRNTLEALNTRLVSIKEQINDKPDINEFKELLNSVKEEIDSLKYTSDENLSAGEFRNTLEALNTRLVSIKEQISDKSDINEFKELLNGLKEEIGESLKNSSNENLNAGKFKNTLEFLNNRLIFVAEQINDKTEINEIKYLLNSLIDISEENLGVTEFRNTIEALNNNIVSVKTYVKEQLSGKTEINELKFLLNSIKEEIDILKNTQGENLNAGEFKNTLESLNNNIVSVREQLSNKIEVSEVKYLLDSLKEASDEKLSEGEFRNALEALSARLISIREQISDKSEINEIKYLLDSLKEASDEKLSEGEFRNALEALSARLISIREQISDKSEINEIKYLLDSLKEASDEKLSGEEFKNALEALNTRLVSIREQISDKSDINEVKYLLNSLKEEIDSVKIKVNEETVTDELKEALYDLQNLQELNQGFHRAQDKLNILIEAIDVYKPEILKNELDLDNKFNKIHFQIDNQVVNSLSSLKECIFELQEKENNSEEIKNALVFLKNGLQTIVENLKYNTQNNISEEILHELVSDVNLIKELTNNNSSTVKFDEITSRLTDLDAKICGLRETTQLTENIEFIKENLCQLQEKFNYTKEKIADFANFTAKTSQEDSFAVNTQLQSIKDDLSNKIEHNAGNLTKFLNDFSSRIDDLKNPQTLNHFKDDISTITEMFSGVSTNISVLCEEVHSLKGIQESLDNLTTQLQFASSKDEISEINNKLEFLTDEIKSYRENLSVIQQDNDNKEILSKIDEMHEALRLYAENTGVDKLDDKISDRFNSLGENVSDVKERIEYLNNALSNLKNQSDSEEILFKIDEMHEALRLYAENTGVDKLDDKISDRFNSLG
ncbi:MAG TPA: hypothetical protein P5556_03605, partial [Candidatus Gastranaerophilales bacterium]|nr:hypothetical protein [Candidatus Gastranaerophilales bacterium]